MQAPLSKRARKILADPKTAKQLMEVLLLSRSHPERNTIEVDGKELRVVRVGEVKNKR